MKKKKIYRNRLLKVLLTAEEYETFQKNFSQTTFRIISDYQRALLFSKPVKLFYRNQSQDEFLEIAGQLMETLRAIERRWTQAVQNLRDRSPTGDQALDTLLSEEPALFQTLNDIKSMLLKLDKNESQHQHEPGV
jgi:hypothetical protein